MWRAVLMAMLGTALVAAGGSEVCAESTAVAGPEQPLQMAVREGDGARLLRLLNEGADPNAVDPLTRSALHYASALGDAAAIQTLIAAGASVNVADKDGFTPLMRAAQNNRPEAVQLLMAAGAEPALLNARDQTARDLAESADAEAVIELLP